MFNHNFQLATFSWEEFCQDTSLEKASWYIEPVADYVPGSPNRSMDFNGECCSHTFGFNSRSVSSPKLHELQPPFRSQRMAMGYSSFYSEFKHLHFFCHL